MRYKFYAAVSLVIEIGDDDFEMIWDSCKHHYDGTIKSLINVGGFIYGYKNRRGFSKNEDKEMELTQRQLGYIMKALEINYTPQSTSLSSALEKMAKELQTTHSSINSNVPYKEYTT